jgi:hypothetical protein
MSHPILDVIVIVVDEFPLPHPVSMNIGAEPAGTAWSVTVGFTPSWTEIVPSRFGSEITLIRSSRLPLGGILTKVKLPV